MKETYMRVTGNFPQISGVCFLTGYFPEEQALFPGDGVILNNSWEVIVLNPLANENGVDGFEALTPMGLNPWGHTAFFSYESIRQIRRWDPMSPFMKERQ